MARITAIQKYCIHDGDGIRTTVFWKGCPLRCAWCHNPETQKSHLELMDNAEKCTGCGNCVVACIQQAISMQEVDGRMIAVTDREKCKACAGCIEACPINIREIAGEEMPLKKLFKELRKDQMFYEESGGGVTFSGGEVMTADQEQVIAAAKLLWEEGISLTIDTCGYAPYENFEKILPYTDTFLYDLKVLSKEKHKQYTGVSNELILENLKKLSIAGAKIYLRIPVMKEVNGTEQDMLDVIAYLQENKIQVRKVNLLPYHNTGTAKNSRLGNDMQATIFTTPSNEEMEHFAELFRQAGFQEIKIGG